MKRLADLTFNHHGRPPFMEKPKLDFCYQGNLRLEKAFLEKGAFLSRWSKNKFLSGTTSFSQMQLLWR
jgi:hypothetical protein